MQLLACLPLLFLPIWLAVWTGLAPFRRLSNSLVARRVGDLAPVHLDHGRADGQVEAVLERGDKPRCAISVSDDGPGLSVEERDLVFERFWRGDAASATTSGSGLGMAIVLAAARRLGGRVKLSPGLEGKGLNVSLYWRLASNGS